MTLTSQILGMLAFLLPLKIVMLLGSPRIPRIFPDVFLQFDRNELVLILCGVALSCFVVNIFVSKAIIFASVRGAKKLQAKAEKITVFKNQNEVASKSYSHYAEALASLAFTSLAITLLAYLYSDVAYFLSGYIFLCLVSVIVGVYLLPSSFEEVRSDSSSFISNLNNVGFFAVFVYVVIDFLYMSPPAFFVAMFSMIMTRRLQGLLGTFISRILSLSRNSQKIDALFFHNKVYVQPEKRNKKSFWDIMAPEERDKWLGELFMQEGENPNEMAIEWLRLRKNSVIGLKVSFSKSKNCYLVKLFDTRASHQAKHELSILREYSGQIPAPELIQFTSIFDYRCNVFKITGFDSVDQSLFRNLKWDLYRKQLEFKPPMELVQRYKRSKLILWQRISDVMFARSILIADRDELQQLRKLTAILPDILEKISKLPLILMTELEGSAYKLTFNSEKGALVANWGNWAIEPIGFGLKFDRVDLVKLLESIKSASDNRSELKRVNFSHVVMAILISELEGRFQGQGYLDSFNLLDKLLFVSSISSEVSEDENSLIKLLFDDQKVCTYG